MNDELIRRLVMRGYTVQFRPTREVATSHNVLCYILAPNGSTVLARGLDANTEHSFHHAVIAIIERDSTLR